MCTTFACRLSRELCKRAEKYQTNSFDLKLILDAPVRVTTNNRKAYTNEASTKKIAMQKIWSVTTNIRKPKHIMQGRGYFRLHPRK